MIMGAQLAQASMQLRFGLAYKIIEEASEYATTYYSTPIGRAWFYENKGIAGYEGREYLDALTKAVEAAEVIDHDEFLARIKARLK